MTVAARISLVTLGVRDLAAQTRFYLALGWPLSPASVAGEVSFFATAGAVLALWSEASLAADAQVGAPGAAGFRRVALAVNLASVSEVDAAFAVARAAGARITKPPVATEWGGYSGYLADPEGNLWEFAHNPGWPLDERGLPRLP